MRLVRLFGSRARELREAVVGIGYQIAKDAQNTASTFKTTVQDDFRAIGQAVADTKESAKDAVERKAESTKEAVKNVYDTSKDKVNTAKDSVKHTVEQKTKDTASSGIAQKAESVAEAVVGKSKETIASVKETVTGTNPEHPSRSSSSTKPAIDDPIKTAAINPMGQTPTRPTQTAPQTPINEETEELQKKGAKRKAEDDSFNLI